MLRRSNERRKCKQQTIEVIKLCLSCVLLFLTDFQTHVFGYPNTLLFYRGIKVHPCDLNAGTQLVYHLMNFKVSATLKIAIFRYFYGFNVFK